MPKTSTQLNNAKISVVTPTLFRAHEVDELLTNLSLQSYLPYELILVDGAPVEDKNTLRVVQNRQASMPYKVKYLHGERGTATQRNVGIDNAGGDFIAFIDDDIRLAPNFFEEIMSTFQADESGCVGGIAGYITNQFLDINKSPHWRVYKRLRLLTTYEPGRYDYQTGSPVNRYLQPPHSGIREIDFMGTNCAVWRNEVFKNGLRFSPFFTGYAVLEDAHLALRARRDWTLLENGRAHCVHLHSKSGRSSARYVAKVATVNHRFVFIDIVPERTIMNNLRFWRLHFFELLRVFVYATLHPSEKDVWQTVLGKIEGLWFALRLKHVTKQKF